MMNSLQHSGRGARMAARPIPEHDLQGLLSGRVASWRNERGYLLRKRVGSPNIIGEPVEGASSHVRKTYAAATC